jgi:hypothetical protein
MSVDASQDAWELPAAVRAGTDEQWWDGLWFEGPLDPRGTVFAVLLALGATVAMVVIAAAVVRIATGA